MQRGEIRYADLGGRWGRRPVLLVLASNLADVASGVTCAPITTTLRGFASRVALSRAEGVSEPSEAVCEALATVDRDHIDSVPLGSLAASRFGELDRAIARALDIRRANLLPA